MYKIKHYKIRMVETETREYHVSNIATQNDAHILFVKDFDCLPHEEVMVAYLNRKNNIIGTATIAMGGIHGCALSPGDVFRGAVAIGASAIIMAHDHPSGDPTPSYEDVAMTKKVQEAGELLGVPLLDHLVIAGNEYRSILR